MELQGNEPASHPAQAGHCGGWMKKLLDSQSLYAQTSLHYKLVCKEGSMEYPDLAEVAGRSKRYWNVDGIPETVMGGWLIVLGVAYLLPDLLPRGSRIVQVYSSFSWLILIASALAANWIIKRLKAKYTFPRGGYVKFQDPKPSQRLLYVLVGGLTAAAFASLVALSVKNQAIVDLLGPGIGVLMSGGFLVASRRPGMRYSLWLSLISLALGAALYPLKLKWMAVPWFLLGMGASFTAVGVFRLRAFIRSVPLPGENEP
ncbi:MAG: hypothetical protein ABIN58_09090 [candidate division WOR-3 bacterium]